MSIELSRKSISVTRATVRWFGRGVRLSVTLSSRPVHCSRVGVKSMNVSLELGGKYEQHV